MINIRNIFSDHALRQKFLLILMILIGIFMLFYWTDRVISNKVNSLATQNADLYSKLNRVNEMVVKVEKQKTSSRSMDGGLLPFIQNLGNQRDISDKLVNIRMVTSTGALQQVSFKSENLVTQDLLALISEIEQYDNLFIKNIVISKRFDNPKRIDATWDIIKSI